jgi:Trk K+ transport system NAD-binding subunit
VGGAALFLALRRLRAPFLVIVGVFAVGMAGLALIPGVDADGRPWRFSLAQALYFMAYTATTIGFGEIPREFSATQRLWVTAVIFASVMGWAYLLASLFALVRDPAFRSALVAGRFRRRVAGLGEPFYLVCGFGETGMLVGRALDATHRRFVLIDIDPARIEEAELIDVRQDPPALQGDAKLPENLVAAGLARPECRGVLALTNDDQVNLAVAMAVRLLHPDIPVLARAMTRETAANMASFGTDHILNPFAKFGGYLALAIASPGSYRLLSWLTGLPGTTLEAETAPPRGHWVVCGYGRFGREVVAAFREHGLDVTVIDPQERPVEDIAAVRGYGTEAPPLREAGIERSVGIVAGTDDDIANLSIAVTARELKKDVFTIVRQNLRANRALFDAFRADITMVSSEIVANECLALVQTPLLGRFLQVVRAETDAWADGVIARLHACMGDGAPEIWSVPLGAGGAYALHRALFLEGARIQLGDLRRDPGSREQRLACMPLYLKRGEKAFVLPEDDFALQAGDDILFAGTPEARESQWPMLRNAHVRDYVLTGVDAPVGWLWQRFARRP